MERSRRSRLLLSLGSGLALAWAFPTSSLHIPVLAWILPALLVAASLGAPRRFAFLCGWLHGFLFFIFSVPWIYTVMRVHGGLGPLSAAGVLVLMVSVLALFPAAFAACVAHIAKSSPARACLAAPFLWVAAEFARTHLPDLGFPWNLLGYAAAEHGGLLQFVTVTGIYGLSFLVMGYNALAAWAIDSSARRGSLRGVLVWLMGTVVLLLVGVLGSGLVPEAPARYVAHLVQVNLPQTTEHGANWMQRHEADLAEIEMLSVTAAQTRPGLVVWPEVPAPFSLRDPQFAARAAGIARSSKSHFLLGVVDWKPKDGKWDGPYNSAALLDPSGQPVFTYDKIHLVPFGEYVPFGRLLGFARQLTAEVSAFKPGREYTLGELPDEPGPAELRTPGPPRKFAVLICFEAVFPGEVRRFVAHGAELLVNLSNDAWFGRSAAPEQHLMMARVRAVENRRWLLRATNNGHTVAVDPYGRIVARLEPDRRGVLAAPYDFPAAASDRTLYTRFGDWLAWLCVLAAVGFVVAAFRRAKASPSL